MSFINFCWKNRVIFVKVLGKNMHRHFAHFRSMNKTNAEQILNSITIAMKRKYIFIN
jgi:hypothetical protein